MLDTVKMNLVGFEASVPLPSLCTHRRSDGSALRAAGSAWPLLPQLLLLLCCKEYFFPFSVHPLPLSIFISLNL